MALDARVENFSSQDSAGADALLFDAASENSFESSGSVFRRSEVIDSLRSVFQEARESFQENRSQVRETLGEDQEAFNRIFEESRSAFEVARQGFEEIRESAEQRFSEARSLSEDELGGFREQVQSLFDSVNDRFEEVITNESESIDSSDDKDFSSGDETEIPVGDEDSSPDVNQNGEESSDQGDENGEDVTNESSEEVTDQALDFNQVDLDTVIDQRTLDPAANLRDRLGENGDVLDGGGGNNVVIGAGGSDIFLANSDGAFNTITTGSGEDLVVLGKDTTNRIFDFDPAADQFGLDGILFSDLVIGQGSNPDNGGLNQPLDSDNNALVIDRNTNNILASLTFANAGELSEDNFITVTPEELESLLTA
ncbi:hypothetical protein ACQ4M3_24290 [Leptolyngbya sp. AN03gr2]|uniref:hypothetical protein n=1 Tax=unclassified Leptolyngbya TaxID=2650499 RepID=UPI003D3193CD